MYQIKELLYLITRCTVLLNLKNFLLSLNNCEKSETLKQKQKAKRVETKTAQLRSLASFCAHTKELSYWKDKNSKVLLQASLSMAKWVSSLLGWDQNIHSVRYFAEDRHLEYKVSDSTVINSSSLLHQALASSFPAELVALMTNTLPVLRRSSASFLFRSVSSILLSSGLRISSLSSAFLCVTVGVAMGWLIFWATCPSFFASWSCKNFAVFLLASTT